MTKDQSEVILAHLKETDCGKEILKGATKLDGRAFIVIGKIMENACGRPDDFNVLAISLVSSGLVAQEDLFPGKMEIEEIEWKVFETTIIRFAEEFCAGLVYLHSAPDYRMTSAEPWEIAGN